MQRVLFQRAVFSKHESGNSRSIHMHNLYPHCILSIHISTAGTRSSWLLIIGEETDKSACEHLFWRVNTELSVPFFHVLQHAHQEGHRSGRFCEDRVELALRRGRAIEVTRSHLGQHVRDQIRLVRRLQIGRVGLLGRGGGGGSPGGVMAGGVVAAGGVVGVAAAAAAGWAANRRELRCGAAGGEHLRQTKSWPEVSKWCARFAQQVWTTLVQSRHLMQLRGPSLFDQPPVLHT